MKKRRLIIWGLGYLVSENENVYSLDRYILDYFMQVARGVDELEVFIPVPISAQILPQYDEFKVTYYSNSRFGVILSGLSLIFKAPRQELFFYMPAGTRIAPYIPLYKLIAKSISIYLADNPFDFTGKTRLSSVPLVDRLYILLCNMYLSLADRVIARGRSLVSLASEKNRSVFLTSPITQVKRFEHDYEYCEEARSFKVMTMSRLAWGKGYKSLLDAFSKFSEELCNWSVELLIAGDGPDRAEIEEYVAKLGLDDKIQFLGWLSSEHEKSMLWGEVDVHVLPTITTEGVPRCIDESILHGVPTIASMVGGIPTEYSKGEVSLYTPGNVAELADRLVDITKQSNRERLLAKAQRRVDELLQMGSAGEQHVEIIYKGQ